MATKPKTKPYEAFKNFEMYKNKKTLQIITKDGVRNILIKSDVPEHKNMIISNSDLQRLREEAKTQRIKVENDIKEKELIKEKSEILKQRFQWDSVDIEETDIKTIDDIDERNLLLNLAAFQRPEHENESKRLDKLILNAKCQAIRDEQIEEKFRQKKIEKQSISIQEKEIDKILKQKLDEDIQQLKEKRQNRIRQAEEVCRQIAEKDYRRIIEKEEEVIEGERILKEAADYQKQENERLAKKKEEQKVLLDNLLEEKEKLIKKRKQEREKEQKETLDIAKMIIEKADIRADEEERRQKEKQQLRIKYQEMVLNKKPEGRDKKREDLILRRAFETKEREWRLQELEKLQKKKKIEQELKHSHLQQAKDNQAKRRLERQLEKEEYEKLVRFLKEQDEQEVIKNQEKRLANIKYAEEMRKQIESNKNKNLKLPKPELGLAPPEKSILDKYDHVLRSKIKKLKDENIADKYLKQVERHYEKIRLT